MRANIWREVIRDVKHLELENKILFKPYSKILLMSKYLRNTSNVGTNYLVRTQPFQGKF